MVLIDCSVSCQRGDSETVCWDGSATIYPAYFWVIEACSSLKERLHPMTFSAERIIYKLYYMPHVLVCGCGSGVPYGGLRRGWTKWLQSTTAPSLYLQTQILELLPEVHFLLCLLGEGGDFKLWLGSCILYLYMSRTEQPKKRSVSGKKNKTTYFPL